MMFPTGTKDEVGKLELILKNDIYVAEALVKIIYFPGSTTYLVFIF